MISTSMQDYICEDCGFRFEVEIQFSQTGAVPVCPVCQSPHVSACVVPQPDQGFELVFDCASSSQDT